MRGRPVLGQVLIGTAAIAVLTLVLYVLVALWPAPASHARFIRFEPSGHVGPR